MEEIFLDIKGFEGLYQISNKGRVKSLKNNKTKKEKLLKLDINSNGYLQVDLYKNNKKKRFYIHRLVAQAFIENPNNYTYVNHKDECKTNNVVTNLEWCTNKYNSNYGTRNERIGKALKGIIPKANPPKQVGAFKKGELVFTFPSTREAKRQGFIQGNVAACCRGERKSHRGYEWRYL